ncbi:MAG TPA: hypothetical protein VFY21_00150 [Xanthobacteraceae bacterium]|nr:hypothetical protein [Xanthobacteraceae bacterium]
MIRMTGTALAAALFLLPATHPAPAAPGPFAALDGTWSGAGSVNMTNGVREPLRCRARYDVAGGGDSLRLELQCASASYKFVLSGEAQARGGAISGAWSESSRNASGTLEGRVAGDRIQATARGGNFAANLALSTRGKRQSVTIEPQGTTEVTNVSVTLNRQ